MIKDIREIYKLGLKNKIDQIRIRVSNYPTLSVYGYLILKPKLIILREPHIYMI